MKFQIKGTVYGTLMNFRGELDALGAAMKEPPYKEPPKAPVLYIKPANTFSPDGAAIALPERVPEVEVGATVGMVMGEGGEIAGYVLLNDLSVPHMSFFRPPVQYRCLDGFLGVGGRMRARNETGDPAIFVVRVHINGHLRQTVRFNHLVRPAEKLLADVSEFMTLAPGDVLTLGCDIERPRARVGDQVEISMPALGKLTNILVAEAA
jgi:5-oxopent-3-ene-1,2,5-tricarboxylate decarboxylase/2-hydroxyhepta-2,4-diene-1,7-dioate isomerase